MYETFEHTADLGFTVRAPDLSTLFSEAGRAFLSLLVEEPQTVRAEVEVSIAVDGAESDYLLFDWLHELLIRFEQDQLLLVEFDIDVGSQGMQAVARGERLDSRRHELAHEVKAITYHQLEVRQTESGWQARVIVDV